MKKILLFLTLLLACSPIWAQTNKEKKEVIDAYKLTFANQYIHAKIDYSMALGDKSKPIDIDKETISPYFALFLFKEQTNRFEYRNKVFYWNNVSIPLFIELKDFLKKFPEKDFTKDLKKYEGKALDKLQISITNGVTMNFHHNNNSYYLTNIETNVNYLNKPSENDFGIFLVEGFPIKTSYLDSDAFSMALDKLNKVSLYKFSHSMGLGNFSTPFESIKLQDIHILEHYFVDNHKFARMKDKRIENRIQFYHASGRFIFNNEIIFTGLDPEQKYEPVPGGGD